MPCMFCMVMTLPELLQPTLFIDSSSESYVVSQIPLNLPSHCCLTLYVCVPCRAHDCTLLYFHGTSTVFLINTGEQAVPMKEEEEEWLVSCKDNLEH